MRFNIVIWGLLMFLASCSSTIEKLNRIGEAPKLAAMNIPLSDDFEEDSELIAKQQTQLQRARLTNSLWQPGNRTFLKDSRTWHVGDIVKVTVSINDSAKLNNSTQQARTGSDTVGLPNLFGEEKKIATAVARGGLPASLINLTNNRSHQGTGDISRKENIVTEIAATVMQVLPNGNLILQGSQEVRVNFELREVKVAGIARPKDISIDNSIGSNQIAEARISYGGRGQVSDVQQPRIGAQLIDVLSPF